MMSRVLVRRFASLAEPIARPGQGKYPVPNHPNFIKLMEKQRLFCRDDGLLVWQKLPADTPLYRAVVSMVSLGVLWSAYQLFVFASPPKNK
ncbi:hypothetical protein BgiMline_007374 [Biomphalaria glabrata]|nr:hypothetical protein BgiMline_022946 [Biomphalaria glabrata]KAI8788046.1 hypothetical protein BgiBS90_010714 [Biomphalaria glabrata]